MLSRHENQRRHHKTKKNYRKPFSYVDSFATTHASLPPLLPTIKLSISLGVVQIMKDRPYYHGPPIGSLRRHDEAHRRKRKSYGATEESRELVRTIH